MFSHFALTIRCLSDFYRRFIRGFSRIIAPLASMLKTTGSFGLSTPKAFRAENDEVDGGDGRADETVVDLSKSKSRRIVKKSEKPQRPEKLQISSVRKNVYQSTDPPSRYKELELPLEL